MSNNYNNLKTKQLVKKRLPYGRYKFIVKFNTMAIQTFSKKYNLLNPTTNKLVKFQSKRERQKVRTKFSTRHLKYLINLDIIENELQTFSIGKTKITFNIKKRYPLSIYFTNKEDITIILMNYYNKIYKIYEVLVDKKAK